MPEPTKETTARRYLGELAISFAAAATVAVVFWSGYLFAWRPVPPRPTGWIRVPESAAYVRHDAQGQPQFMFLEYPAEKPGAEDSPPRHEGTKED